MDEVISVAKNIELVVFDVDGVLTDGRIVYDSQGNDYKFFNVQDGLGISLLRRCGIQVMFMSAKSSKVIKRRAMDCRVELVLEDISDKKKTLLEIGREMQLGLDRICFVGDDLVDLGAMKICGLPVAVANAAPEVKAVAKYVTKQKGGCGAVREICEIILKAKGYWEKLLKAFSD